MTENLRLGGQVLCLFLVDFTLASVCGLLFVGWWTGRGIASDGALAAASVHPRYLAWPPLLLLLALCAQLWLLTMAMAGVSAPARFCNRCQMLRASHAGRVTLYMLSLSLLFATHLFLLFSAPHRLHGMSSLLHCSLRSFCSIPPLAVLPAMAISCRTAPISSSGGHRGLDRRRLSLRLSRPTPALRCFGTGVHSVFSPAIGRIRILVIGGNP
jgi:hypothetical protein